MSDTTHLRHIAVLREPKNAAPIALRILGSSQPARSILSPRSSNRSMLRQVLRRTLGFGSHFAHAGDRHVWVLEPQSFALRRMRRPGVDRAESMHRFRWPSSRVASAAGSSTLRFADADDFATATAELHRSFDFMSVPPDDFGFATEHDDEGGAFSPIELDSTRPVGMQLARLRPELSTTPSMPLQRAVSARQGKGGPLFQNPPSFFSSPEIDFAEERDVAPPQRPSLFLIARELSGEFAPRTGEPIFRSGLTGAMPTQFGSLPLMTHSIRGKPDNEVGGSALEQVLQRTSWQPVPRGVETLGVAGQRGIAREILPVGSSGDGMPLSAGSVGIAGGLRIPPEHRPDAVSTPYSRVPVAAQTSDIQRGLSARRTPARESDVPRMPFAVTPGRPDAEGPAAQTRTPERRSHAVSSAAAVTPETEIPMVDLPIVLRRVMAGPQSRGWTETGPISPIWGELGRLVQSPPVLTGRVGQSSPSMQLRSPRTEELPPASPTRARVRPGRAGSAAPSTWQPPTIVATAFPPVHRSALTDRAEPGIEQHTAAHSIMSTSAGAPLSPLVRRTMEDRIGVDFGSVRVHSGPSIGRATDLLAARAMSRGSDIFMPAGAPDSPNAESMPLLAHELTHVAAHLGQPPAAVQPAPLVLAQRVSSEEQRAEQIERAVSSEMQSRGVSPPSTIQPAMTLARGISSVTSPAMPLTIARAEAPAAIQRDETVAQAAAPPTPAAPGAPSAPADTGKLAEKVYALLERRLLVERERGGYRRT